MQISEADMTDSYIVIDEAHPPTQCLDDVPAVIKVRIINTTGNSGNDLAVRDVLTELGRVMIEEVIIEESSKLINLESLPPMRQLRVRNAGQLNLSQLQGASSLETLAVGKKRIVIDRKGLNLTSLRCLVMPFARESAVTVLQEAPNLKKLGALDWKWSTLAELKSHSLQEVHFDGGNLQNLGQAETPLLESAIFVHCKKLLDPAFFAAKKIFFEACPRLNLSLGLHEQTTFLRVLGMHSSNAIRFLFDLPNLRNVQLSSSSDGYRDSALLNCERRQFTLYIEGLSEALIKDASLLSDCPISNGVVAFQTGRKMSNQEFWDTIV